MRAVSLSARCILLASCAAAASTAETTCPTPTVTLSGVPSLTITRPITATSAGIPAQQSPGNEGVTSISVSNAASQQANTPAGSIKPTAAVSGGEASVSGPSQVASQTGANVASTPLAGTSAPNGHASSQATPVAASQTGNAAPSPSAASASQKAGTPSSASAASQQPSAASNGGAHTTAAGGSPNSFAGSSPILTGAASSLKVSSGLIVGLSTIVAAALALL